MYFNYKWGSIIQILTEKPTQVVASVSSITSKTSLLRESLTFQENRIVLTLLLDSEANLKTDREDRALYLEDSVLQTIF